MTTTRKITWSGTTYDLVAITAERDGFTYATLAYQGGDYRDHTREAAMWEGEWMYVN